MAREFAKSFYHSREWQQVRSYCLMRDKYLCQHCGCPAESVHHVIHLNAKNIYDPSIALNPDNLISLCRDCHFEEHRGEHGKGRQTQEVNRQVFDKDGYLIG